MRIILLILAALGALALGGLVTTADAADTFARQSSVKDDGGFLPNIEAVDHNPFQGFHVGAFAGAQFTNIAITDTFAPGDNLSGIAATGGLFGLRGGYNFCIGRVCVGPYAEYAVTDVSFEMLGEPLLTMDDYGQIGVEAGGLVGKSTFISLHVAREWQSWTVGNNGLIGFETDADATAWVVGGGLATMISPTVSLDLRVDYVMTDELGDTDSLRVKLGVTYRPQIGLPALR